MSKLKLKVYEIEPLLREILGYSYVNQATKIQEDVAGFSSYPLPMNVRFWLNKLIDELQSELERVTKLENEILEKYLKKDENGQFISREIKDGQEVEVKEMEDVKKDIMPLRLEEIEVDFKKIKLADVKDIKMKEPHRLIFNLIEA